MTTITLSIPDDQWDKLKELATRLRVSPEEVARAGVEQFVSRPDADFELDVKHILEKNAELYRRLA